MKVELTTKEILEMYSVLESFMKEELLVLFKFDLAMNLQKLKPIWESYRESISLKGIEGYEAYDKEHKDLALKHSDKGRVLSENMPFYLKDKESLDEKHKVVLDKIKEIEKNSEELLKTKQEVEGLVFILLSRFPEKMKADISALIPIIKDDRDNG